MTVDMPMVVVLRDTRSYPKTSQSRAAPLRLSLCMAKFSERYKERNDLA